METLPFEIGETAHALRKAFDRRAVGLGVTRAQWKVLFKLTRHAGPSPGRAGRHARYRADHLVAGSSTGSRKRAWSSASRDPADRRAWRLHVTAKAQPLVDEASRARRRADRPRRLPESTAKDIETTRQVLARVRDNAGRTAAMNKGVEPMNKMTTEPMTGTEPRSAEGRAQTPARQQALLRHDPDADRAGACSCSAAAITG